MFLNRWFVLWTRPRTMSPRTLHLSHFRMRKSQKGWSVAFYSCLLMRCERNPEAYQVLSSGKTRRGRDVQNQDCDQTGNLRNLISCSKYDLILIAIIGPPGDHERPRDASQRPSPHANSSTNWGQGSHGRCTYDKVIGFSQILSISFHPSSCLSERAWPWLIHPDPPRLLQHGPLLQVLIQDMGHSNNRSLMIVMILSEWYYPMFCRLF